MKEIKKILFCLVLSFSLPISTFVALNSFLTTKNQNIVPCNISNTKSNLDNLSSNLKLDYTKLDNTIDNFDFITQENDYLKNQKVVTLNFNYGKYSWTFTENDLLPSTHIHTITEKTFFSTQKSGYANKLKILNKIKRMGFSDEVSCKYIFPTLQEKLNEISIVTNFSPKNAQINYNKSTRHFEISNEISGQEIDFSTLYTKISQALQTTNNVNIDIPIKKIKATTTYSDLLKSTTKQSTFSTNYQNSNVERKNNIKIATEKLNGTKINPGEVFSFNQTVGKRIEENGFKEANIIKEGEFVKGLGGGVCQVSSTLYNALLLSGINVTEVHQHSLPVSYVKPGFDAMVSWSTADLKFKNATNSPIFITSSCDGKNISFSIYGDTKSKKTKIKQVSQITNTITPKADKIVLDTTGKYADKIYYKGEFYQEKYAKNGLEANAYLEFYENNELKSKKLIRTCKYSPQQGIIYEGIHDFNPNLENFY